MKNAQRLISNACRQMELEAFDPGPVPDDGVLVENEYTAVSVGTELYNWLHGADWGQSASFPRTTGYCNAGRVLEVGKNRVAGQGNHASHSVLTGVYHKVPDAVSSRHAAFLVMAAIALHGIRRARIALGESVAVLGLGLVGQFSVALARLAGAMPLIAIDLDDSRLEKARGMGAEVLFNPEKTSDLVETVRTLCREDGANVVIEATGNSAVYPTAMKLACQAGRVVATGSPRGPVEMDFFFELHLREVELLSGFHPITPEADHLYYRWTKQRERAMLLDLMADPAKLPVEHLITHVARPDQCQEIYDMLADDPAQALGVAFEWRQDT